MLGFHVFKVCFMSIGEMGSLEIVSRDRGPQVLLLRGHVVNLDSLGKQSADLFGFDAGDDHTGVALFPVGRSGDLFLGGELERVDHPENLVKVSPGGGGIQD